MKKLMTLAFIVEKNQILLALKKRGFGMGRYNGYGGKVNSGENIEETLVREMKEESGIQVIQAEKVGIHTFMSTERPEEELEVHVFHVTRYTGEAVETEEMKPEWFALDAIPFEKMWPDDIHWFPVFLNDKRFRTKFLFGENDTVLEMDIQVVETL